MLIQARIECRKKRKNGVYGGIFMVQPSDSVGFWASDESITLRLEMLGGYELVIEKFGAS
jgi:hypothetical protein